MTGYGTLECSPVSVDAAEVPSNTQYPIPNTEASSPGLFGGCATSVETSQGDFVGFLNKFKTPAFRTDDFGHPKWAIKP